MKSFSFLLLLAVLVATPAYSYTRTGIIEVYSEPSGAKVYVDGTYVGKTPYTNPEIATGKHEITVILSQDYPPQVWEVRIDEITPQTKTFYFRKGEGEFTGIEEQQATEKYTGNVQFASIPTNAMVYINGKEMKPTPLGYKEVAVGRYSVEFRKNGKSLKGYFNIIKDETVKLIGDFNKSEIINKWVEAKEKAERETADRESKRNECLNGFTGAWKYLDIDFDYYLELVAEGGKITKVKEGSERYNPPFVFDASFYMDSNHNWKVKYVDKRGRPGVGNRLYYTLYTNVLELLPDGNMRCSVEERYLEDDTVEHYEQALRKVSRADLPW